LSYGETFIEKGGRLYDSPYKFNGKELDKETGLYYYGVRYYDPKISLWLSVDPLAEKYPSVSPYTYTYANPIRFMDPTGMEGEESRSPDEWIKFSTGEVVRVGDKGGDEKDYVHTIDADGNITTEVLEVKTSYVSDSGTEIPRLIEKSPGKRVYDATPPAIQQVCLLTDLVDIGAKIFSDITGLNEEFISLAAAFFNPKSGLNL